MDINKWLEDASNEWNRNKRNNSNEFESLRNTNGWRHQHAKFFSSGRRVRRYKNVEELKENYQKRKREESEKFQDIRKGN